MKLENALCSVLIDYGEGLLKLPKENPDLEAVRVVTEKLLNEIVALIQAQKAQAREEFAEILKNKLQVNLNPIHGEIIDQVLDTLLAAYERGGEYSLDRQFGDVRSDLENLTITK